MTARECHPYRRHEDLGSVSIESLAEAVGAERVTVAASEVRVTERTARIHARWDQQRQERQDHATDHSSD